MLFIISRLLIRSLVMLRFVRNICTRFVVRLIRSLRFVFHPDQTNQFVQTRPQHLPLLRIHLQLQVESHLILHLSNPTVEMIHDTLVVHLISFCNRLQCFSRIKQIFIQHFQLRSRLQQILF